MKRYDDHGNSLKKPVMGEARRLTFIFRGSVHYHHVERHGDMQADVALEWRALQFDVKATCSPLTSH